jgi:hypothetical protein
MVSSLLSNPAEQRERAAEVPATATRAHQKIATDDGTNKELVDWADASGGVKNCAPPKVSGAFVVCSSQPENRYAARLAPV